jgi:PucR C-terminal helix-turn-helix domain/GGDEF-like domain
MSARDRTLISDWEARLHANALASQVLSTLNERKFEVERCALDGLQRENAQFSRAGTPQFREEALGHCNAILELMLAIAESRTSSLGSEPFRFVETHAKRRARQRFPLAGSLNAYRLAHRGYWEVMRSSVADADAPESEKTDCLMILSEFLLEFFDRISGIMTDAYFAEEKSLTARGARAQAALIEDLMHGRQPGDLEAQALCERAGIRDGATLAVVIGRVRHPGKGQAINHRPQAERLPAFLRGVLIPPDFPGLIDARKDEVIAIVAGDSDVSIRAAQALRTTPSGMSAGWSIGVSLDALEIRALPQACQEAERAVEFTGAHRTVMHFGEIDLMEFLVRRPDAAAQRLIPTWAGRLKEADGSKSGALSRTIRQFAACDLNVKRTARDLNLHTNTVYFRLNHVRKLTGIDPRSYLGLSLLLTTLQMLNADEKSDARRQ